MEAVFIDAVPDPVDREVTAVGGDGAYGQAGVCEAVARRGATALIPPRRGAGIKVQGNTKGDPDPRDAGPRSGEWMRRASESEVRCRARNVMARLRMPMTVNVV